ncbi:MAG: GNAT family N-acetyltransferase [Ruminococcaceae bacterium]|nr:GNAT family N-acetyltransferase [Oscillospiraceae bacterium]
MKIRNATYIDLDEILEIYARARSFMRDHGNPTQWGDSYPPKELIVSDLEQGCLRVLIDDENAIAGVFSCFVGGDPDYDVIKDGAWLNDEPYTAIHRIASAGTHKGIFTHILEYCLTFSTNVKVDTHLQNTVMQSVLQKHGFKKCGTITAVGLDFIAFQFVK